MEIKSMTVDELNERKTAIALEVDGDGADLDALELEVKSINEELEARKNAEQKKAEIRSKVAEGTLGTETKNFEKEEVKKMETTITRNSPEYIDAYARYIKTGKADECRSLLTTNASGVVIVPELVENAVKHAWDNEEITALLRKTNLKGNIKIGFEISADGAVVHTEGTDAPDEENITMGIVTIVPSSVKKFVTISDEALDMDSQSFLTYVYDEITHQIAKKVADLFVAEVVGSPATSSATAVGVPTLTASTIAISTIAKALAKLSDEARNPVIIMNKQTFADFKDVQYANKYPVDIFEGLNVVFNNSLKAFSSATTGDVYAIVGDLGFGGQLNFPNGTGVTFKYDDLSLAESDLVKIVGREYVGIGVVAPNAFVNIKK